VGDESQADFKSDEIDDDADRKEISMSAGNSQHSNDRGPKLKLTAPFDEY
jgi:hypothetical protein